MNIQIKEIVNYKGHSVKTNGNVDYDIYFYYMIIRYLVKNKKQNLNLLMI